MGSETYGLYLSANPDLDAPVPADPNIPLLSGEVGHASWGFEIIPAKPISYAPNQDEVILGSVPMPVGAEFVQGGEKDDGSPVFHFEVYAANGRCLYADLFQSNRDFGPHAHSLHQCFAAMRFWRYLGAL